MKRNTLRTLCFLLTLVLLAPVFVSCSRENSKACISYGDYRISRATFQYLCCMTKTDYLYEAYGIDSSTVSASQLSDNAMIWAATASDGVTAADSLKMEVTEILQLYLYLQQYAKDQGYQLNSEQRKMVKDEFDSMISQNFNDKKSFNEYLAQYGTNYDEMLEYNMIQTHAYQGEQLLFGENGSMAISEDSAQKYFNKNYITVECIFINTANKTYPNGKVVILPADEKKEKEDLANTLEAKLNAGEDFASLCLEYSDLSPDEETALSGYTFSSGGFVNFEAEKKAFEAQEGVLVRLDTDSGTYFLRRKALDASCYETEKQTILDFLENAKKSSLVADNLDKYKLDEEFLEGIDVASLPHVV